MCLLTEAPKKGGRMRRWADDAALCRMMESAVLVSPLGTQLHLDAMSFTTIFRFSRDSHNHGMDGALTFWNDTA